MADTLSLVSLISFIAAGVFFITAIVLFFVFRIPTVLGYLTKRNAKRSIARRRKESEDTGNKASSPEKRNVGRGKLIKTGKNTDIISSNGETGLLRENYKATYEETDTGVLGDVTETLDDDTVLLDETANMTPLKTSSIVFEYIEEVTLVHTDEVIT